ncbi:MAG TPA: Ig-like domain-containing protein [Verrucomicrobiota bacterium]|nr:Ig-like domain-containing protein [Verrucomicrobiota bacterium]
MIAAALSFSPQAVAEPVHHGVAAGRLVVSQVPGLDDNTNAVVTLAQSINNFQIGSYNRGDYAVRIGVGMLAAEDSARGVLMASVAENGRNNFGTNGYPTCSMEGNSAGALRISTALGGSGGEYNVNVAGAWFPYDRYLAGWARNANAINGGTNDLLTASPGIVLGTHFRGVASGRSVVDLRSFGVDARQDGVLLVTHGKDEGNFALSQVNPVNGTWNVFVRDNAQATYSKYEQDPVAFVFIPKTNAALISGRFNGDGSIDLFSGVSPRFSVTNIGTGRWLLRMRGYTPAEGVLIISAEGGGSLNGDNVVSYEITPDGEAWEIQSRDTPGMGLQTPVGAAGQPEAVASFVFIPAPTPGVTVTPTNNLVTRGDGGTATFAVVLHSSPATNVHIQLTSSDPALGRPTPATLTFRSTDWHLPQTVTVTGGDALTPGAVPYHILLSPAASGDAAYRGLKPEDVAVVYLPAPVAVITPPPGALNISPSPMLTVVATNPAPEALTVTFYGREVTETFPGPDFCIVALPDTQVYVAEKRGAKKEMFIAQTEWIVTNRIARNIAYVAQLGDIVNDGDIYQGQPNLTQWRNATNAMYRLENPVRTLLTHGIPYGVAVGNHEQQPRGDPTGTTYFYNLFFGLPHFSGRPYHAGHYGTNNNNHFDFFSASGLDFVVLYFEYDQGANPAVLAWGSEVLRTNAHRRAIVVTHHVGNSQTPSSFSLQGSAIYNALKGHTNLFLMLGGHITGQGSRQDIHNGNIVRSLVADYQGWANGGNGFMRIMEFSPSNNLVVVQTYSPWTKEYLTDEHSEFWFDYPMQPAGTGPAGTAFVPLGTNTNVTPGSRTSLAWPSRRPNQNYEWFVTVTDAAQNTWTSRLWRFTTTVTNTPPVLTNRSLTLQGDTPTRLLFQAMDVNQDPLTYHVIVAPTRGLMQDFDPVTGSFLYVPARGFRGMDRITYRARDGQAFSGIATLNLNVIAPPDANGNGLPDAWELYYGITDPEADDDDDGLSNRQEYWAHTNPTNAASAFRILNAAWQPSGHFALTWASVGGVRYRVQYTDATHPAGVAGTFTDLQRGIELEMDAGPAGVESTQTFADDFTHTGGPPARGARYYRVRIAP